MSFDFVVPSPTGPVPVTLEGGSSAIFVGANGGGKTRLAVHIENEIQENAHRVSAHRSLSLNPKVAKIAEDQALGKLRFGEFEKMHHNVNVRKGSRWGGKSAVHLLNDFDSLIQALFAEQTNTSLLAYHARKRPLEQVDGQPFQTTKMDKLKDIWERLLPHRLLQITGDDISVTPSNGGQPYEASEMSDGERAIFYMIGQVLVAADSHLLIIDEPELHVHPSIISKLWDELEAARSDCAFVYITHDLMFAKDRNAQKFVIRDYAPTPTWVIEAIPEDTGFSEELTTLILGSRRPILFVEGKDTSLDLPIYRACYPEWTIIPRSSCTEVIHSVVTMRNNESLTRVTCSGIVDGDDYNEDDKNMLRARGIQVLPVSEIENMILIPSVAASIAESEGHVGGDRDVKIAALAEAIFAQLDNPQKIEKVVVEYCKRRIDRALKKVDLSAGMNLDSLKICYNAATAEIDISTIASQRTNEINDAIAAKDLSKLLEYYDNKGLLALAASHLRNQKRETFEAWLIRSLRNDTCLPLKESLKAALPNITAA
jgi:hypothetical protein